MRKSIKFPKTVPIDKKEKKKRIWMFLANKRRFSQYQRLIIAIRLRLWSRSLTNFNNLNFNRKTGPGFSVSDVDNDLFFAYETELPSREKNSVRKREEEEEDCVNCRGVANFSAGRHDRSSERWNSGGIRVDVKTLKGNSHAIGRSVRGRA